MGFAGGWRRLTRELSPTDKKSRGRYTEPRFFGIIPIAMETIGDKIFAKDAEGNLLSRIGTIFFRTPGLVTAKGVHATQRMMWLDLINAKRAEEGLAPMTEVEEEEELEQSVDLIFTDAAVLIRPDPNHLDLAFRADDALQKMVSKRRIRFLNTRNAKVRNALRERGENWRMARAPISQEDMIRQIESSKVAIDGDRIYYYNHTTGTRYLTAAGCMGFEKLEPSMLRSQFKQAQEMLSRRNRVGMPEIDLFPVTTPIDIKQAIKALDVDALSDSALKDAIDRIYTDWRISMPIQLRDESVDNYEWRNEMSRTLSAGPNETAADDSELVQGISPEFYRQIEWLPGARIVNGQLVFDTLWEEFMRTRDPELAEMCDQRARMMIFDFMRLFADIEYVNIGRITRSLAREPIAGTRRGGVYIIQLKTAERPNPGVFMLRFHKWGVVEHLDEGKDLLRAVYEADEYSDYVLDRRLMCQQLGMPLPPRIGAGQMTEIYNGSNRQYAGTRVKTCYLVRSYITGVASDKVPVAKFRNPAFALAFAYLMGRAAALDLIVGRMSSETNENLFDKNYEVLQLGESGIPERVLVTNHVGTFVNYLRSFEESIAPYADVVHRRKAFVSDYKTFVDAYVEGFKRRFVEVQSDYRERRDAFNNIFVHRPYDVGGSGAYRWAKTLERLDNADVESVVAALRKAIGV